MKIALVRARYSPYGGAERFAMRAMKALSAGGADITIIARSWSSGWSTEVEPATQAHERATTAIRFLRCDPFFIGSLWRDASFARAVHKALKYESFDLVQSHERIAGLPIYRAGDGVHAVWLERRGAQASAATRWGMRLNPHHRYLLRAERAMFEHPALRAVICNSQMVRDEILQRFAIAPDKLCVIANGVDLERFHPSISGHAEVNMRVRMRAEIAATAGLDPRALWFVLVGSGFERKGVATALRALDLLGRKRNCAAALVIVGGDKHIERYRKLARQLSVSAYFAGEQADVAPWYALADAFVLPSIYDPFPNAALEALACGLPIIVSDACGAKEVVTHGQSGWVCAAGDDAAFVAAMGELCGFLAEPAKAAMLRASARVAAEPYSLSALGDSLQNLYRSLLQHGV